MAMNTQIDREIDHGAPIPRKKSHAGFLVLLFLVGAALAAGIAFELMQRKTQDKTLAAAASDDAARPASVNVGRVKIAPASSTIELPCQTLAMVETPIYARADGYIKQRPVDIGDRVKKGQLAVGDRDSGTGIASGTGESHACPVESGSAAVAGQLCWRSRAVCISPK